MKKIRSKKCVVCNTSFKPFNSTLQRTCSVNCAIIYSKLKEAAKKSGLNDMRNEKTKISDLSKLVKNTQDLVNKFVRLRDQGKNCISCNHKLGLNFDAGHIFSVKQHSMIRFNLNIIFGQCYKCNRYEEGNYDNARLNAQIILGDELYQKVLKQSKIALRIPYTWSRVDLIEIQLEIKERIKQLKYEL